MSLQGVIARWGSSYTVYRAIQGDYVKGVYTDGSMSEVTIIANIQPVTGDDLKTLPEGQHADAVRVLFTETELNTRESGFEPDQVGVDGLLWEVISVEKWTATEWGTHYRCMISKMVGSVVP